MLSKTIFSCHWRDQEQMPCAILPAIKKSSLANVCYKPKSHQTPLGTPLGQQSMIANKSRVKSLYSQRLWRAGGLNFFSGKRQGVTRSLFQFSRREREFFSFNLMFETRTRISFSQSRFSFSSRSLRLKKRNSHSRLEARDWKKGILVLVSNMRLKEKNSHCWNRLLVTPW